MLSGQDAEADGSDTRVLKGRKKTMIDRRRTFSVWCVFFFFVTGVLSVSDLLFHMTPSYSLPRLPKNFNASL